MKPVGKAQSPCLQGTNFGGTPMRQSPTYQPRNPAVHRKMSMSITGGADCEVQTAPTDGGRVELKPRAPVPKAETPAEPPRQGPGKLGGRWEEEWLASSCATTPSGLSTTSASMLIVGRGDESKRGGKEKESGFPKWKSTTLEKQKKDGKKENMGKVTQAKTMKENRESDEKELWNEGEDGKIDSKTEYREASVKGMAERKGGHGFWWLADENQGKEKKTFAEVARGAVFQIRSSRSGPMATIGKNPIDGWKSAGGPRYDISGRKIAPLSLKNRFDGLPVDKASQELLPSEESVYTLPASSVTKVPKKRSRRVIQAAQVPLPAFLLSLPTFCVPPQKRHINKKEKKDRKEVVDEEEAEQRQEKNIEAKNQMEKRGGKTGGCDMVIMKQKMEKVKKEFPGKTKQFFKDDQTSNKKILVEDGRLRKYPAKAEKVSNELAKACESGTKILRSATRRSSKLVEIWIRKWEVSCSTSKMTEVRRQLTTKTRWNSGKNKKAHNTILHPRNGLMIVISKSEKSAHSKSSNRKINVFENVSKMQSRRNCNRVQANSDKKKEPATDHMKSDTHVVTLKTFALEPNISIGEQEGKCMEIGGTCQSDTKKNRAKVKPESYEKFGDDHDSGVTSNEPISKKLRRKDRRIREKEFKLNGKTSEKTSEVITCVEISMSLMNFDTLDPKITIFPEKSKKQKFENVILYESQSKNQKNTPTLYDSKRENELSMWINTSDDKSNGWDGIGGMSLGESEEHIRKQDGSEGNSTDQSDEFKMGEIEEEEIGRRTVNGSYSYYWDGKLCYGLAGGDPDDELTDADKVQINLERQMMPAHQIDLDLNSTGIVNMWKFVGEHLDNETPRSLMRPAFWKRFFDAHREIWFRSPSMMAAYFNQTAIRRLFRCIEIDRSEMGRLYKRLCIPLAIYTAGELERRRKVRIQLSPANFVEEWELLDFDDQSQEPEVEAARNRTNHSLLLSPGAVPPPPPVNAQVDILRTPGPRSPRARLMSSPPRTPPPHLTAAQIFALRTPGPRPGDSPRQRSLSPRARVSSPRQNSPPPPVRPPARPPQTRNVYTPADNMRIFTHVLDELILADHQGRAIEPRGIQFWRSYAEGNHETGNKLMRHFVKLLDKLEAFPMDRLMKLKLFKFLKITVDEEMKIRMERDLRVHLHVGDGRTVTGWVTYDDLDEAIRQADNNRALGINPREADTNRVMGINPT